MDKNWHFIEQEVMKKIAAYRQECTKAQYERHYITHHFRAVMKAVRHFMLRGASIIKFVTGLVRRNMV